jgi:hypothetical protein
LQLQLSAVLGAGTSRVLKAIRCSNSVRNENISAMSMESRETEDNDISSFSGYFLLNV